MFKIFALCVLICLPSAVRCQSAASVPAEKLTLSQAIDAALRQNRLVNVEKLEVEKAGDRLAALATRRLPGFDVSVMEFQWFNPPEFRFNRGVFGQFPGLGPVPPTNTTVTSSYGPTAFIIARATQPLTQLHRINLGIKMSELGREVADSKLTAKKKEIAHQVKQNYYAILRLQSALTSSEETLKLYRELDRLVSKYVTQQVALASDSLDAKTQLAKEELETLKLQNNLAAAKESLNQLLARDIRTEFMVDAISANTVYEVELSLAQTRALAERPELKEAQLKLKLAEYDHRLKKAEAIPEISATAGYFSAFGVSVLPQNASGIGFTLSWEPFDWGRRKHELSEKQKTIEQAREGLRETESSILRDVGDKFRKLQEARALMRVSQLAQESAREKLRVATNKYSLDAVLYKEVLQKQADVATAQDRYQQALLVFWTARADFEKAIGEL